MIGVVDAPGGRPPGPERHAERAEHEFGAPRVGPGPADARAPEGIQPHGELPPALGRGDRGTIGHPEPLRGAARRRGAGAGDPGGDRGRLVSGRRRPNGAALAVATPHPRLPPPARHPSAAAACAAGRPGGVKAGAAGRFPAGRGAGEGARRNSPTGRRRAPDRSARPGAGPPPPRGPASRSSRRALAHENPGGGREARARILEHGIRAPPPGPFRSLIGGVPLAAAGGARGWLAPQAAGLDGDAQVTGDRGAGAARDGPPVDGAGAALGIVGTWG